MSSNNILIKCIEEWKLATDTKLTVGCVAIDLTKAFDSIQHKLLIAKLNAYGVSCKACDLINSYLSSRKQRVKLNGNYSEWLNIQRGVPQGSIMGPVLFNIYLNDLLLLLQNFRHVFNYADDNTLSFSHKNPNIVKENLELTCKIAIEWFRHNYMKVNAEKFQFMILNRNSENVCLNLNGNMISATKEIKLLGVTIDRDMCFNSHIQKLCLQSSRQINVLSRLSNMLTLPCKMKILNAFIISNFNYCCLIYHHCNVTDAKRLERLMKRALRFVYLDFTSSYKELLVKAKRSSLYVSRLRIMLLTVYKILHGMCPPVSQDLFQIHDIAYNLRRSNVLVQRQHNTSRHGFNSIRYKGAMLWNQIPDHVKTNDFTSFKDYVFKWQPECMCGSCLICII